MIGLSRESCLLQRWCRRETNRELLLLIYFCRRRIERDRSTVTIWPASPPPPARYVSFLFSTLAFADTPGCFFLPVDIPRAAKTARNLPPRASTNPPRNRTTNQAVDTTAFHLIPPPKTKRNAVLAERSTRAQARGVKDIVLKSRKNVERRIVRTRRKHVRREIRVQVENWFNVVIRRTSRRKRMRMPCGLRNQWLWLRMKMVRK